MCVFTKLYINHLVKHKVLPMLTQMSLGEERFIVDSKNFRIKAEVDKNGHRRFTIHQKVNKGRTWSYTTYNADEAKPFPMRSGSYPGNWDK